MSLKLPRLSPIAIVDGAGRASSAFQRWWQSVVEQVESSVNAIAAALAAAVAAQAAADSAQDDATQAIADALAAQGDAIQALTDAAAAQTTADGALTEAAADALYVQQDVGAAWTSATGTEARTALASYAGQTVSNPPTQVEMQAIDDAVVAMSQALVAVINDLKGNGALT